MRRTITQICKRLGGETRGAEIAEAAAVLPIVFLILVAILWFGQAFRIYTTLAHAAREGARAGSTPPCATCAPASVGNNNLPFQLATKAVQDAMLAAKLDPANLSTPAPQTLTHCDNTSSTTCDSSTQNICVETNVQRSSSGPLGSGAGGCGISVTLRYPYKFWLPGNALNLQTIQLTAVGHSRMETR